MKKFLLITLLLISCYNNKAVNLTVKSCNLPYSEVKQQIPIITGKDATLYLQVKENDLEKQELKDIMKDVKEQRLKIIVWPLLPEEEGPWANDKNYDKFTELVSKVVAFLNKEKVIPQYLVINMENTAAQMDTIKSYFKEKKYKPIIDILIKNINRKEFNKAVSAYKDLVDQLHTKGYKVMITTYPFMLDDMQDGDPDIQDMANIPISGINWDAYTFTPYRTAYSGDFDVKFSPFIVYDYGLAAKTLYKEKARLALGIVGKTDHGPGYASPNDLSRDIAAAKAAGIKQVDLFFLKGMIEEGGVESWIDADVDPKIPYVDIKVTTARVFVRALDKMLNIDAEDNEHIYNLIDSLKAQ